MSTPCHTASDWNRVFELFEREMATSVLIRSLLIVFHGQGMDPSTALVETIRALNRRNDELPKEPAEPKYRSPGVMILPPTAEAKTP